MVPAIDPPPAAAGQAARLGRDQIELLELVARGLTDRVIAQRLGISVATVQRRRNAAAVALGVQSRVALVVRSIARGVIDARAVDRQISELRRRPDPIEKN